jgi:tetratricopeptide (TPR) repeat protein
MLKNKYISALLGGLTMLVVLVALSFIPSIHARLLWKLDEAYTYSRLSINPAGNMPTAKPVTQAPDPFTATPLPPTATLAPDQPTATPVTPTPTPTQLPESASLQAPEYEKQNPNNCGPTNLSTFLRFYGWDGNQFDIADVLKSDTADRNVNVEELVYYVRNHAGWLNIEYRVGGDIELLKTFLANGFPVMIEESMKTSESYWPGDDLWAGHYLFINGYKDSSQSFVSQDSFYGPDKAVSYTQLEKNWQSFNHVYIVIYLPEQEATVKAIMGDSWDKDANRQKALEDAQAATVQEPKNAFHWFNVGSNLVYFDRYAEAAVAFDKAREIGLPQRMLRYQFSPFMAYFNALRTDDLVTITEYALKITANSEEAHLWHGWGLFRQGDTPGAEAEFRKALSLNESYADAQYALNFLYNQ